MLTFASTLDGQTRWSEAHFKESFRTPVTTLRETARKLPLDPEGSSMAVTVDRPRRADRTDADRPAERHRRRAHRPHAARPVELSEAFRAHDLPVVLVRVSTAPYGSDTARRAR